MWRALLNPRHSFTMNTQSPQSPQSPSPSDVIHYNDYGPGLYNTPLPVDHELQGPPPIRKAAPPQNNSVNHGSVVRRLF